MLFCAPCSNPRLSTGLCSCSRSAGDDTFRMEGFSSQWPKDQKAMRGQRDLQSSSSSSDSFLGWGEVVWCVCVWCFWEHLPRVIVQVKRIPEEGHLEHTKCRGRTGD